MATVARTSERGARRIETCASSDRALLRSFLEQDRLYAAYALCDLDEREFKRTRWGVAFESGRPIAVALEYRGSSPQSLFVMGKPSGVAAALKDVIRPQAAYLAALPAHLAAVDRIYRVEAGPAMVRMVVDRSTFTAAPGVATRLGRADLGDLNRLYNLGFTTWLPSESVVEGVYYGVRIGGRLVAAAGTHVVSSEARLGVVGNVMTHRDHRGRGLAKAATGAVTAELLATCDQVVLNVRSDNPPALAAYRALGYREHIRFEERLVYRRGLGWDSIVAPLVRILMSRKEP